MKRKFKPRDVVEFNAEVQEYSWCVALKKSNGCGTFIVASYATEKHPDYEWNELDNVHITQMDGQPIRWDKRKMQGCVKEYGIYSGHLQKNKFLTAVHKAQKRKEK